MTKPYLAGTLLLAAALLAAVAFDFCPQSGPEPQAWEAPTATQTRYAGFVDDHKIEVFDNTTSDNSEDWASVYAYPSAGAERGFLYLRGDTHAGEVSWKTLSLCHLPADEDVDYEPLTDCINYAVNQDSPGKCQNCDGLSGDPFYVTTVRGALELLVRARAELRKEKHRSFTWVTQSGWTVSKDEGPTYDI